MEYLTRLLAYTTDNKDFRFHALYKSMRLTHLMFADDLLLFCKGDAHSMMTIMRTFSMFSNTLGLNMSKGKSNAYFNGVNNVLRQDILQVSGIVEGRLPFRYLGIPIKITRLTTNDCRPLIDKVVSKTRSLGCKETILCWKVSVG
ncbi:uncharacterized protein LOC141590297 [Silene latifolia]|uniref:uncharacterized protein LOC141590297 n=1 Tax=Silene latifolia TaxID=37657 RepID=UPI003D76A8D9